MTVFTADLAHISASHDITSAKSRVIVNGVHTPGPLPPSDKASPLDSATLLRRFITSSRTLKQLRQGEAVSIDGRSLSIADVAAVARYNTPVQLSSAVGVRDAIASSRRVIEDKVRGAKSVYGVSTGFGGSADTRTADTLALGNALLQHQHAGVLSIPDDDSASRPLPLLDPLSSTSMPESWVRGAMLVRLNSLARGHSGVRWELLERMVSLLQNQVTPLVPLRGSISASGDLSPLSYIAGTIVGNPSIRAWSGPAGKRTIVRSSEALHAAGLSPLPLHSKEHLGILNGTAFSASVAGLALHDATHLAILAQICTAMGVEALVGTQYSFDPFIHAIARPHPGQVESATVIHDLLNESQLAQVHEEELTIENDRGLLRQDRYALRTAPQFIGPALEDILSALDTVTQECNSTTDNPLIDGETGQVHHGGNFQAMAVSSAMEKTRLALYHAGKLLFAQCTELLNPAMNRGLPPSLAATDPSHNYHGKGLDIATAAYVSELGYLANPVSTHIQSAEMHNQAVNSLALISARKTIDSVQILAMLSATYLYLLCQAIDLRVLQDEFLKGFDVIIAEELNTTLAHVIPVATLTKVLPAAQVAAHTSFALTATMDANERLVEMMGAVSRSLLESLALEDESLAMPLTPLRSFRSAAATRGAAYLQALRRAFLTGERGVAPAAPYLKGTRPMYEFVRVTLGIRMHGRENLDDFEKGLGVEDVTIGQNVSKIYETILDERMKDVIVGMYD